MKEIIDQVLDELRGAWRYRWYALAAAWAIALAGWLVVLVLPNKYQASARIFVDPTTALRPVITGIAIEQDVNAELNLVRQSLLSERQLQHVIDETGLGTHATTPQQKAGAIADLRNRIDIGVAGAAPSENGQPSPSKIYTISFLDSDRDRSLKIVQILVNNLVEGTLGGKREGSQQAQKFLEDQIRDYESRLANAEQRLADFKKQNTGMVPGEQQGDYFTRLQTEVDGAKRTQVALNAALSKRETLDRQLRGEGSIAASAGSLGGGQMSGAAGTDTLSRIKETQAKLDQALERFTDKHPDVIALRQTLEQLQARRKTELEALKRGDPNAAALTGASSNPVYQSIQLAINQADIEIAALRADLGDRQQKVSDLKRMVDTQPQVEAEFARLNRDYSVTKAQYTALAERLEKARVGEEADQTGAVRFEVIDPPFAPFKPVFPKRSIFMAAVLAAAFAIGAGMSYVLNMFKPAFNSIRALSEGTGLPVLGAISLTRSDEDKKKLRADLQKFVAAAACLLALFVVAVLIGQRYAPLGSHISG
jgi:polysaccharide chain length determinant protein (PEP-CTERM system associated)